MPPRRAQEQRPGRVRRVVTIVAAVVVVIAAIGWLGFHFPGDVTPPKEQAEKLEDRSVVYDGLPPALQYYLAQTVGRAPYITRTAIVWGTGALDMRLGPFPLTVPVAWWEAVDAKRGYVWKSEIRWWEWAIATATDRFDDGTGVITFNGVPIPSPWAERGQKMQAVAQLVWLPSALISTDGITWLSEGDWSATVRFPAPHGGPDSLAVAFDPRTRALESLTGKRLRSKDDLATWSVKFLDWDSPGGLTVPTIGEVTWNGKPYYRFRVDGIRYNADVSSWFAPPKKKK